MVSIPGISNSFQFLIPESMMVGTAQNLICNILQKAGYDLSNPEKYRLLCVSTGKLLSSTLKIKGSGIVNGTELLLMEVESWRKYE